MTPGTGEQPPAAQPPATPPPATPRFASSAGARRAPFVVVVLAMLAIGLVGQLMLNTSQQRGSFRLHDMQAASSQLAEEQQVLEEELARRESPAALAQAAQALGMVPSGVPVFLQLADGSVQGTPTAAPTPTPTPSITTPAAGTPAPSPAASQSGVLPLGPGTDPTVAPSTAPVDPSTAPDSTAVGATA